jgi:hypothetical protein
MKTDVRYLLIKKTYRPYLCHLLLSSVWRCPRIAPTHGMGVAAIFDGGK